MRTIPFSYGGLINNRIESENGRKIHLKFERKQKKGNYLYLHTIIMQVEVGVEERFFKSQNVQSCFYKINKLPHSIALISSIASCTPANQYHL